MRFTKTDLEIIRSCFEERNWRGKRIVSEFPAKQWTVSSVNRAIRKIELGGANPDKVKKPGSGRPRTARTQQNVGIVKELAHALQTEGPSAVSQRSLARQLNISRRSVQRMLKNVLDQEQEDPQLQGKSSAKIDQDKPSPEKSTGKSTPPKQRANDGDGNPVGKAPRESPAEDETPALKTVRSLVEEVGVDNVYAAIETSLYFRAVPEELITYLAVKKQTERVSVLMTCNLSGTAKRRLLVVGVSKNPRCFQCDYDLPVEYASEKTARVTEEVLTPHLERWDEELVFKKRRVALLVNSSLASPAAAFQNIRIVLFPDDSGGHFCQGIVKTFKMLYRTDMQLGLTEEKVEKSITLLDAVNMMANAWSSFTQRTFRNCFRKAGLQLPGYGDEDDGGDDLFADKAASEKWMDMDSYLAIELRVDEDE